MRTGLLSIRVSPRDTSSMWTTPSALMARASADKRSMTAAGQPNFRIATKHASHIPTFLSSRIMCRQAADSCAVPQQRLDTGGRAVGQFVPQLQVVGGSALVQTSSRAIASLPDCEVPNGPSGKLESQ